MRRDALLPAFLLDGYLSRFHTSERKSCPISTALQAMANKRHRPASMRTGYRSGAGVAPVGMMWCISPWLERIANSPHNLR
jgi:hypothetical protein